MASAALVAHPFSRPKPRSPQTIVVRAPRAPAKQKKTHRRSAASGLTGTQGMIAVAIAGYVLGNVDKGTFGAIPSLPVLGRAGTIALALHYLGKGNKLMRQAAIAAAAIAGYEMGGTGKIAGGPVRQL